MWTQITGRSARSPYELYLYERLTELEQHSRTGPCSFNLSWSRTTKCPPSFAASCQKRMDDKSFPIISLYSNNCECSADIHVQHDHMFLWHRQLCFAVLCALNLPCSALTPLPFCHYTADAFACTVLKVAGACSSVLRAIVSVQVFLLVFFFFAFLTC